MRSRSILGVTPRTLEFDHGVLQAYPALPNGTESDQWYLGYSTMESMEDITSKTREVKPCSHTRSSPSRINVSGEEFAWYNYAGYGGEHFNVTMGGFLVIPKQNPTVLTVPWSEMASSLSEKLSGRIRSKSLLAVTIRELPKTIGMARNPFNLLKHDWRRLAGPKKTAKQLFKSGANVWLEAQYGWNSLFVDLGNFAKSYGRILSVASALHEQESENGLVSYDENRMITGGAPFLGRLVGSQHRWGRLDLISKGCFTQAKLFCRARRARAELAGIDYVLNSLGLDNKSLLDSLWEVVPFSFVADWFIKLPSITAPLDYSNLTCQAVELGSSVKTRWDFNAEWYPGVLDTYWATGRYDWVGSVPIVGQPGYKSTFSRAPGLPQIEGIRLSGDLSTVQLTSLGALIVQAANGKR